MTSLTSIIEHASSNINTYAVPVHAQGATNSPALTPLHWWDHCGMSVCGVERNAALAPIAAAFNRGEAQGVLALSDGFRCTYASRAWALAMTAVYGPVGTRQLYPTDSPTVVKAKARALADLQEYLSV